MPIVSKKFLEELYTANQDFYKRSELEDDLVFKANVRFKRLGEDKFSISLVGIKGRNEVISLGEFVLAKSDTVDIDNVELLVGVNLQ